MTVDTAGLQVKGASIAWREIESVQLTGGTLMVERHGGGWFNDAAINHSEVPNVELLIQTAGRRIGAGG